jgi:hypothetical protein
MGKREKREKFGEIIMNKGKEFKESIQLSQFVKLGKPSLRSIYFSINNKFAILKNKL